MMFSHLCWQCSDKTRKCQEHKNTLRKKEKLIFLMPILEIKTKNLFLAGKGTRVLVPGHQNSGAPTCFWGFSWNVGAPEFWWPWLAPMGRGQLLWALVGSQRRFRASTHYWCLWSSSSKRLPTWCSSCRRATNSKEEYGKAGSLSFPWKFPCKSFCETFISHEFLKRACFSFQINKIQREKCHLW